MNIPWFRGLACLLAATTAQAQPVPPSALRGATVPPILRIGGTVAGASGKAHTLFTIYTDQTGGTPLWTEGQEVSFDAKGAYSILLGSNHPAGLPQDLFTQGAALWLGVQVDGQAEEPRILLVSVPYALKAGDAETIGGKPLSAFVLANPSTPVASDGLHYLSGASSSQTDLAQPRSTKALIQTTASTITGTLNQVAKFDASNNLVNSSIFDNGLVGIGTASPAQALDVAGSVNLSGKLLLPATVATSGTPTAGVIQQGGNPVFHSYAGPGTTGLNVFAGTSAGNFSMGGTGSQGSTNAAFGVYALRTNSTGSSNAALGFSALIKNTSGTSNTAAGTLALNGNTTGGSNAGFGRNAIYSNTTGTGNTALGALSLFSVTGSYNIGLGYNAGSNLTSGTYNIDLGNAGVAGESGTIRIGDPARQTAAYLAGVRGVSLSATPLPVVIDSNGQLGTTTWGAASGTDNTATGTGALASNTGTDNTAIGFHSLTTNSTGAGNTAVGSNALTSNTTGNDNNALGGSALQYNTAGYDNNAFGYEALMLNTTGNDNNAFGLMALYANTTGSNNAALGSYALDSNTSGTGNCALGFRSLSGNTSGNNNTAMGLFAMAYNSLATGNVALGSYAMTFNTTGSGNVAVGQQALYAQSFANGNTTWNTLNTAIGYSALATNQPADTSTGIQNTAVGGLAAYQNTTGVGNSALGMGALYGNTTGSENTAIGHYALYYATTGGSNTALGSSALGTLTTGSNNIGIGHSAGQNYSSTEANNIAIANPGTVGDSGVIRIGTSGVQSTAYMAGVHGVTPGGSDKQAVVIDANGQLGSAAAVSSMSLGATQTGTVKAVGINYIISLYGIFPPNSTGSTSYTSQMIGEIRMFAGNYAPEGWAFCDGALLSISSNTALFSILGTTYGGDGKTTFALPDLRSAVPMHTQQ